MKTLAARISLAQAAHAVGNEPLALAIVSGTQYIDPSQTTVKTGALRSIIDAMCSAYLVRHKKNGKTTYHLTTEPAIEVDYYTGVAMVAYKAAGLTQYQHPSDAEYITVYSLTAKGRKMLLDED